MALNELSLVLFALLAQCTLSVTAYSTGMVVSNDEDLSKPTLKEKDAPSSVKTIIPDYTTVDRWEQYFAGLAMDCLDGVQLNSAQEGMLRVHSVYSSALEEMVLQTGAAPQMWSVQDIEKYVIGLKGKKRALTRSENSIIEVCKIYVSELNSKDNAIEQLHETCATKDLQIKSRQPSTANDLVEGVVNRVMKENTETELKAELLIADNEMKVLQRKMEKSNNNILRGREMAFGNYLRSVSVTECPVPTQI